ncbi:EF-P lysine aminoacylase EpmA [Planctomycetaceae bacterium]|jgi:elongation factor P--(R)-beta-lysine ligase|nr:EF-P lysine aminoacylase EpmA [Planctomycetaceae bacterium]MDC0273438.1 EF-P lysine aminoacylase EpmA [Planctomycetaceae bacterium]MDG2390708.1 EF-P lysine aminoacylase EpmA [Planctomycetaceae bacterium]
MAFQEQSQLWQPTASWRLLKWRSLLLQEIRDFLTSSVYLEVETPSLSQETVVDANLDPIEAHLKTHRGADPEVWYLQTSPEFGMKRLLADLNQSPSTDRPAGLFQISKAFRNCERGDLHNPEFTMLEWYGFGATYQEQMAFTERLVRRLAARVLELEPGVSSMNSRLKMTDSPFHRLSYDDACERVLDCRVLNQSAVELLILCRAEGVEPPPSLDTEDRDALLNLLLAEKVEPTLGTNNPEFLCDYPTSQSALAKVRADDPPVTERFELYWDGIELCNGYQELTDPEVLRQRVFEENSRRLSDGAMALPAAEHLLSAMESGLPECSGVALGFDRLVMLLLGQKSLKDVLAFPCDRA